MARRGGRVNYPPFQKFSLLKVVPITQTNTTGTTPQHPMKPDDIEQRVCDRLRSLYGEAASPLIADIEQRQAFGLAKYGVRLADNPAPLAARLRHMLEELLDSAVYAEWVKEPHAPISVERINMNDFQRLLLWMAMEIKKRCADEPPTSKPVDDEGEERL